MPEATDTVEVDERGRLTLDRTMRKKLNIDDGDKHIVEITVTNDDESA